MGKPRTAMVLAAGLGKRLQPLTLTCPKPLLPVGGKPILHTVLQLLQREGFQKVVINLHHLGHKIKESVGDGSEFGLEVLYSEEKQILGTGGGIKAAQHLLGDETFLVISGDVLIDAPLREICDQHTEKGGAVTLVVKDDPSIKGYGDVLVDKNYRIRQIIGRPPCEEDLIPMLFTNIHVIEPTLFDFMEPGKKASITQDVYIKMLESGLVLNYYEYKGYFLNLNTVEMYETVK